MSEPEITYRKISAIVPISCCLLSDSTGENHCTHEPYVSPPIPWHRRLRWSISSWWFDHRPRVHFGPCEQGEDW